MVYNQVIAGKRKHTIYYRESSALPQYTTMNSALRASDAAMASYEAKNLQANHQHTFRHVRADPPYTWWCHITPSYPPNRLRLLARTWQPSHHVAEKSNTSNQPKR